jgi:hypothetical protein
MKKSLCLFLFLITLIILNTTSCNFAPGSYPYAEIYKLNISDSELITAINKFKRANPDYSIPAQLNLKDGQSASPDDHWYHVYFYLKDHDQIIYTWVRKTENNMTSFALVSFNEGLSLGKWKDINKDFNRQENKLKKKEFEERILNVIKQGISVK